MQKSLAEKVQHMENPSAEDGWGRRCVSVNAVILGEPLCPWLRDPWDPQLGLQTRTTKRGTEKDLRCV